MTTSHRVTSIAGIVAVASLACWGMAIMVGRSDYPEPQRGIMLGVLLAVQVLFGVGIPAWAILGDRRDAHRKAVRARAGKASSLSASFRDQGIPFPFFANAIFHEASAAYDRARRLGLEATVIELIGLVAGCETAEDADAAREAIALLDHKMDAVEQRRALYPNDGDEITAARARAQASIQSSLGEIETESRYSERGGA